MRKNTICNTLSTIFDIYYKESLKYEDSFYFYNLHTFNKHEKDSTQVINSLFNTYSCFLLLPAPIDPAPYTPSPIPELTGVLTPNTLLKDASLLALGKIHGPEEVAVDKSGYVYGGTMDGKIIRIFRMAAMKYLLKLKEDHLP